MRFHPTHQLLLTRHKCNITTWKRSPWNKPLQVPGWLFVTRRPLLASVDAEAFPSTQLPFSIMFPFCGCPLPRGRRSVSAAYIVCCSTLAARWPPPSLPTISCPGMIMSSFRTPCFEWLTANSSEREREREQESERQTDRGEVSKWWDTWTCDLSHYKRV